MNKKQLRTDVLEQLERFEQGIKVISDRFTRRKDPSEASLPEDLARIIRKKKDAEASLEALLEAAPPQFTEKQLKLARQLKSIDNDLQEVLERCRQPFASSGGGPVDCGRTTAGFQPYRKGKSHE